MNVLLKYKLMDGINWENHNFIEVDKLPEENEIKKLSEYQDCEKDKTLKIKEIRNVDKYVDDKSLLNNYSFYKVITMDNNYSLVKVYVCIKKEN